jgi:hypothetical protein
VCDLDVPLHVWLLVVHQRRGAVRHARGRFATFAGVLPSWRSVARDVHGHGLREDDGLSLRSVGW